MAKVSVPISNLQEGDTIAVDDLDLYIERINKLDGQSAAWNKWRQRSDRRY